ncbi:hypothetical protein [Wandonia haliotis]
MQKLKGTAIIIFLTLFNSCEQLQDNREVPKQNIMKSNELVRDELSEQKHYFDTAFTIDKNSIRLLIKDISEEEITLAFYRNNKVLKLDTLQSLGIAYFEFVDYNQDNFDDFLIAYIGNIPTHFIYLFDPLTNEFRFVEGLTNFPEAKQLKANNNYYYSYYKAGCADMNWVSDLFYIDNFEKVHIGHIYGQGCDYEVKGNPQTIELFKVLDNDESKKILVEKLPYLKHIPNFDDKWIFIEKYWNKNYSKYD